jgi:hypothetical protein
MSRHRVRTLRSRARGRATKHPSDRLAHVRSPAGLPAPVSRLAHRLDAARDRRAGRRDPRPRPHRCRDRRGRGRSEAERPPRPRRRDRAARPRAGRVHLRAADHLRAAGARCRVRPARRAVLALPPALVRLLRPQPDGSAHVPRDDRPASGALLPGLRADLLRAARHHHRGRHRRPLRLQLAARSRRPRDHAGDRPHGVSLQPRVAPRAARRPADARRRLHRGRGVDHRRARREVVRAGGAEGRALPLRRGHGVPEDARGQPPARLLRPPADLPAVPPSTSCSRCS